MPPPLLDQDDVDRALGGLHPGWRGTPVRLRRGIVFADFPTAVRFVDAAAVVAEELDHHPDVLIRWRTVDLALSTHSAGGVTRLDVELAGRLDAVAAALPQADKAPAAVPPGLFAEP